MQTNIKTTAQLVAAIEALPAWSREVYEDIHSRMYAEPGFSDVTADDLNIPEGRTQKSLAGAIAKLLKVGLIWSYTDDVDGTEMTFLHSIEHDNEIPRIVEAEPKAEAPAIEETTEEMKLPDDVAPAKKTAKPGRYTLAAQIIYQAGTPTKVTDAMVAELDTLYGKANPVESRIALNNATKAIHHFLQLMGNDA